MSTTRNDAPLRSITRSGIRGIGLDRPSVCTQLPRTFLRHTMRQTTPRFFTERGGTSRMKYPTARKQHISHTVQTCQLSIEIDHSLFAGLSSSPAIAHTLISLNHHDFDDYGPKSKGRDYDISSISVSSLNWKGIQGCPLSLEHGCLYSSSDPRLFILTLFVLIIPYCRDDVTRAAADSFRLQVNTCIAC